MLEFTQFRIAMCGQHFTVSVDVNAGALRSAPAGCRDLSDRDRRSECTFAFSRFDVDLSRRWVAVFGGFTGIQNAHHFKVHLADFHCAPSSAYHISRPCKAEPGHDFRGTGRKCRCRIDRERARVHIRRRAFQTVQAQRRRSRGDNSRQGGFVFIRVNSAA